MLETPEQKQRRYEEMADLQARKKDRRKKPFRRSKLDPFRRAILDFADQGIGPTDIADWLAQHKKVRVDPTTVLKRIQKWNAHA